MLINILTWCVFGLIVGALARYLVPGSDPAGCLGTILIGIAGSFLAGFLANLLFGGNIDAFQPTGAIGSVIGAVIVVFLVRKFKRP